MVVAPVVLDLNYIFLLNFDLNIYYYSKVVIMPNKKGGKNFKKGKKNRFSDDKKQLVKKDPDESQEYAQVVNAKGNGRFELNCCDGGKTRMGTICGTMRKRVWVNRSDLVLISRWEGMTDDTKCSIIHKYTEDEAKRLQKEGELPENFKLNLDEIDDSGEEDDYFNGQPSDSSSSEEEVDIDEI
jgi:translation initiation factor 1A